MKLGLGSDQLDPLVIECLKHSGQSLPYVHALVNLIRSEFGSGRLDQVVYEKQIDILTVLQLQIEQIQTIAKEKMIAGKGVLLDVRV